MSETEILVEQEGGVRIITLNRPDRLNALVPSMMAALVDAVADAARDPAAGCVVVTGAGRGFCSGGDLKGELAPMVVDAERGSRTEQGFDELRGFVEASRLLHDMPKPTIAMVNGPVAGAGIGIAGACDLRFAGEMATFVTAFDRIGASGDFGSTWFWTRILGSATARELFFLGEKLSAADAHARGLYTKLFADADLREATLAAAHRLADGPRMAWRYMKANFNMAEDGSFANALDQECLNMGLSTAAAAAIRRAARDAQGN
ncbi:enoyl-CoA hydratase-related protein [Sphingomonas bacterium]|uniref:enoyl-CoA hydratase-related protein n=1 Tax=Sphingomonas bacterium TaxID=1895847 RepID=UPI001575CFF1|nr:enoyl-CoA hydratase-related protein [Sphingomonas bacterium]